MQNDSTLDQSIRLLFRIAWIVAAILLILAFATTWALAEPLITTVAGNRNRGNVRVTRTAGNNPFIACAVINDGADP
jgi:hypothetical protein